MEKRKNLKVLVKIKGKNLSASEQAILKKLFDYRSPKIEYKAKNQVQENDIKNNPVASKTEIQALTDFLLTKI